MDRHQGPVYHLVSKGETVFGIARKFQITPGELREWNTLADDNIKTGQKLIVGYAYLYKGNVKNDAAPGVVKQQEIVKHDPVIISEPVKKVEVAPLTSVQVKDTSSITLKDGKEDEKQKSRRELRKEKKEHEEREEKEKQTNTSVPVTQTIPPVQPKPVTPNHVAEPLKPTTLVKDTSKTVALNGKLNTPVMASASGKTKLVVETGIATWIDNTDINPNRYFALHRTAPIGTIIRVRNKMNSKYVFVKVVGVLPDTGDNANLIIKLSKAGAVKLDVIDARFQAELSFEVPE
jgi:rare lipoprotein A (peptidoglycan hydrolase)